MPYLIGQDSGLRFELRDFDIIGRNQDASVRLPDAGVSRQHASIQQIDGLHWLTDLGSANGSFINDVAVTMPTVLRHGDRVRLGSVALSYESDVPVPDAAPAEDAGLQTLFMPAQTSRLTLLVGDLCGFTSISEKISAEQVAALLREFYASCEQILCSRGAVIDKFLGDGVFAYWRGDDAATRARATECARLLSRSADTPVRRILRESMGLEVRCNVGLHVGEVAMGGLGRGISTAVGEAVNTAFRVEGLTRKLEAPIAARDAFVAGWPEGESHYRPAGTHPIKGYAQPISVWVAV